MFIKTSFALLLSCFPFIFYSQSKKEQIKFLQDSVDNLNHLLSIEHRESLVKDSLINVLSYFLSTEYQNNMDKDSIIIELKNQIKYVNSQYKEPVNILTDSTENSKQDDFNNFDLFNSTYYYHENDSTFFEKYIFTDKDSSEERHRLSDAILDNIEVKEYSIISLVLTINQNGDIVKAINNLAKTTTTDRILINKVTNAVTSQVKYNKSSSKELERVYLNIRLNPL